MTEKFNISLEIIFKRYYILYHKVKIMYNVSNITKFIISYSNSINQPVTNLRLQKLLYYSQGFYLAFKGQELFNKPIVAWKLGPVVESVYFEYKDFGKKPLATPKNFNPFIIFDNDTMDLIKNIIDACFKFSTYELVDMTHKEEPWKQTPLNKQISLLAMRGYFIDLVISLQRFLNAKQSNQYIPTNTFFELAETRRMAFYQGTPSTFSSIAATYYEANVDSGTYISPSVNDLMNLSRDLAWISIDQQKALQTIGE